MKTDRASSRLYQTAEPLTHLRPRPSPSNAPISHWTAVHFCNGCPSGGARSMSVRVFEFWYYAAHPELCNSVGSIAPHLGLDRSEFRVRAARAARSRPDMGARSNHPDIAA